MELSPIGRVRKPQVQVDPEPSVNHAIQWVQEHSTCLALCLSPVGGVQKAPYVGRPRAVGGPRLAHQRAADRAAPHLRQTSRAERSESSIPFALHQHRDCHYQRLAVQ